MDLIITSQYRSTLAWICSRGKVSWSSGEAVETTLEPFLKWLIAFKKQNLTLTIDSDISIVLTHKNQLGIETHRTVITCNPEDRITLLAALQILNLPPTISQNDRNVLLSAFGEILSAA